MKTGEGVARKMVELVCTGSQLIFGHCPLSQDQKAQTFSENGSVSIFRREGEKDNLL